MIYRTFGKTGWRVGQIGVGCCQFGGPITVDGKADGWTGVSDAESIATIQRAIEMDVNFFDTAAMYGWGRSEAILGRAIRQIGARERVFIATKVGYWHDDEGRRTRMESYDAILNACEESLQRLDTDYIDLYQCHVSQTDRCTEFLDAFATLERQGKIRFFGVSSNQLDVIQQFDQHKSLAAVQADYSLLNRRAELDILPLCRARGIAFIARRPLAMGKLSGSMTRATRFEEQDVRSQWNTPEQQAQFEADLHLVERLRPIAQQAGLSLVQLALKFVLSHVAVSVAIPGAKNREQLEHNVGVNVLPALVADEMLAIRFEVAAATGSGTPAA
jgi:myo-inositol catabolism protein IolS